jgi:hypothetical protein
MKGFLNRKFGTDLRIADMIAQYLPLRELRIVALISKPSIVTYCERRYTCNAYFFNRNLEILRPILLYSFRNLKILDLVNNRLKMIPDTIGHCIQLEYLDLRKNCLLSIPDTIGNCSQLWHLRLGGNRLQNLPDTIGNCKQLTYLDLTKNQIKILPDTIENCAELKVVYVRDNPIACIPLLFPRVKIVY